jgi:hypothetical protein
MGGLVDASLWRIMCNHLGNLNANLIILHKENIKRCHNILRIVSELITITNLNPPILNLSNSRNINAYKMSNSTKK